MPAGLIATPVPEDGTPRKFMSKVAFALVEYAPTAIEIGANQTMPMVGS
jgi:hypothetical protein